VPGLKVAVLNNVETSVADVQLLIDGKSAKRIPIYSGHWADFGSYEVEGEYQVVLKVIRYHADSGELLLDTQSIVKRRGAASIGFRIDKGCITITVYPEMVVTPQVAEIPESATEPSEQKPEDVIPSAVSGFKFIERSEFVEGKLEGEEYSAYSLFQPAANSEYQGKVESLEVRVRRFEDEASAGRASSILADGGTAIRVGSTSATLTYNKNWDEAAISWHDGRLVFLSSAVPPSGANDFDSNLLKEAAILGVKAATKKPG